MVKKIKKKMSTKFKVVNIIAVRNTGFPIKLKKVQNNKYCTKILMDRWEKEYTYIQTKGATKQITIFYNGNMISIGNSKVSNAKRDLEIATNYLKRFKSKC